MGLEIEAIHENFITGLRCLRDHIDGHNKHIIRLAEKDVNFGTKKYKYFAMQSTGGGHFPSNYAHAETALNVFKANIIPILGLDRDGIEYDIVQVRSCARGVTAQNAFRMSAPASNMVMVYGLGGKLFFKRNRILNNYQFSFHLHMYRHVTC